MGVFLELRDYGCAGLSSIGRPGFELHRMDLAVSLEMNIIFGYHADNYRLCLHTPGTGQVPRPCHGTLIVHAINTAPAGFRRRGFLFTSRRHAAWHA